MDTKPVFHGSDIEKICSYYNLKKENIVKFGANVNPLGLSPKAGRAIAEHVDILSSYPDREYTSLRNTISSYCNIPADFILPGNGSSELISLLIQERAPKHTLILGPTYSEYSRELSFSGSTQEYYHLQESNDFEPDIPDLCRKLEQGYDFLILCNPNNPTSSAITHEELRRLIGFCAAKKYLRDDRRNLCGICPGYQRHHRSSADTGIHQSHGTPRRIQILRCSRNAPGLRHHRKYGLSCKNARKTDTMVT